MTWTQVNSGMTYIDIYALAVNGANGPDIFAGITWGTLQAAISIIHRMTATAGP